MTYIYIYIYIYIYMYGHVYLLTTLFGHFFSIFWTLISYIKNFQHIQWQILIGISIQFIIIPYHLNLLSGRWIWIWMMMIDFVLGIRFQIFQKWNQTVKHSYLINIINVTSVLESCEPCNTSPTFGNNHVQSSSSSGGNLFQLTYKCDNIVVRIYDRYLYFNDRKKESINSIIDWTTSKNWVTK